MRPVYFETLNFQRPHQLEGVAAGLIVAELIHKDAEPPYVPNKREISGQIEYINYSRTHSSYAERQYACISTESGLVAVTKLAHGLPDDVTFIDAIAVSRAFRRRGYGRMLMHYAAQKALEYGDTQIGLEAYEPIFFQHLGFVGAGVGKRMYASARVMLAR